MTEPIAFAGSLHQVKKSFHILRPLDRDAMVFCDRHVVASFWFHLRQDLLLGFGEIDDACGFGLLMTGRSGKWKIESGKFKRWREKHTYTFIFFCLRDNVSD